MPPSLATSPKEDTSTLGTSPSHRIWFPSSKVSAFGTLPLSKPSPEFGTTPAQRKWAPSSGSPSTRASRLDPGYKSWVSPPTARSATRAPRRLPSTVCLTALWLRTRGRLSSASGANGKRTETLRSLGLLCSLAKSLRSSTTTRPVSLRTTPADTLTHGNRSTSSEA